MELVITKELVQKLLTYLVKQPYHEVFQFIPELSRLKVADARQDPPKEKE